MKAGNSNYDIGTRVRIISSDDKDLIGATGELTHPFPGLMWPGTQYVAGLYLDEEFESIYNYGKCNLMRDDIFEVID